MNKIAYLSNPYPAISHTFIYREIESLRREGFEIATASISRAADISKMSKREQQEAAKTLFLKETTVWRAIQSLCFVFAHSPSGFFRMCLKGASFACARPSHPLKAVGYLVEAVLLIYWLRKQEITHIHEHFANPTAFVALLCKTYGGFSFSLSIHGPDVFYEVSSSALEEKVSEADFVRCISHYCKSQLMRILPYTKWSHQHIVRCGVDSNVYVPAERSGSQVPTILCVGRLCPAKGQHILLEACAAMYSQGRTLKVILVGDGPDRGSLEKLAHKLDMEPYVTFTGALGQNEVLGLYRNADVFVLPSFAEGVPVVLMEAMAMEIPSVSTRITGIPELIEHGKDGFLATPGDTESLTRQLEALLDDPDSAREIARAGRRKVLSKYNQNKNNSELAELFRHYGGSNASF